MNKTYAIDILDWEKLLEHVERKEVTMRFHPVYPQLVIFNYADIVAIKGLWTHETKLARGLIVDLDTNEVIARPFAKFFNYGQAGAPEIDLDASLYGVGNKYDGSLGIVFHNPYTGGLEVATRGSFESDQARVATEMLKTHDRTGDFEQYIAHGLTPLVEIIYPENRIVVNYGTWQTLVYLGVVDRATGDFTGPLGWQNVTTMRDMLALSSRPNAEGWVVWLDSQTAVKIKQQDYIELHRIVTGLNRKSVWRALSQGQDVFEEMLEKLPDELYDWAEDVAQELNAQYALEMRDIDAAYLEVAEAYVLWGGSYDELDRALFARLVRAVALPSYQGYMFSLLDDKDIQAKVWKSIEPKGGER